jgi:DNA-binding beta-propeller fold protein YncE
VVNHLSDSVSIVDTTLVPPRVVRTLLVGDEPRDIVIASGKAFITTAHRGQNTPWQDGDYDTPGIGRADVWVFDVSNPGAGMGGTPLTVINLFGDRPRALAASPDGTRVYAAVFRSGNQTVPVGEDLVCNGTTECDVESITYPGGRPDPKTGWCGAGSSNLGAICRNDEPGDCFGGSCVIRESGVIVGYDEASGLWLDEKKELDWSPAVPFDLPDYDVFEIDAAASTPVQLGPLAGGIREGVPHVGTILFNMIVNPSNGDVYVSNTDANNRVRFEGMGDYVSFTGPKSSGDPASVRGEIAKARVTVLDASSDNGGTPETEFSVIPQELNTHIPYGVAPVPAGVAAKSIATPTEMAITSDGATLYVAGVGSNGVHIYDTAQLKAGTFTPNTVDIITLPSMLGGGVTGGASGLVLDEARGRLYVTSRATNETYIFNTSTKGLVGTLRPHNPEPAEVIDGRPFLYDAKLTGSNGEASCSSCHIFGDMDDLSWDLGDPDAPPAVNDNPSPLFDPVQAPGAGGLTNLRPFDPQKGPMTTQSLRGMVNAGPMHWRGDRTGPACEAGIDFLRDPTCENEAFNAFNVAFPGLIGRDEGQLTTTDMQAFTDFALRLTYPPNPIRNLDNSLDDPPGAVPSQKDGETLYSGPLSDGAATCNGCHSLNRAAGFFGASGASTIEGEAMEFKVPHLRNAYQKVGMFGRMPSPFFPDALGVHMGPQVRGTGFLHDGSVANAFDFVSAGAFSLNDLEQRSLEAFMMAFDSDLAPIVGQQITLTDTNLADVQGRIDLLIERSGMQLPGTAELECELIVKGVVNGEQRGWLRTGSLGTPSFLSDKQTEANWTWDDCTPPNNCLIDAAAVPGQALTFTCVPPSNGFRMSVDRDRDNFWDNDDPFPDFFNTPDCGVGRTSPSGSAGSLLFLMLLGLFARRVTVGRRRRR